MLWYFWYASPYFEVSGGLKIVLLLLTVNFVLGPVATFAVFDKKKSVQVLKNDILILLVLQVSALIYGISVAAVARPVALVFAKDRFSLITANQVRLTELRRLKNHQMNLPWADGPMLLSIRSSVGQEALDSVELASHGFDLPSRPSYWESYAPVARDAFQRARPLITLVDHYKLDAKLFEAKFLKEDARLQNTAFLPLETKVGDWIILLGTDGAIAGFAPFNGFF